MRRELPLRKSPRLKEYDYSQVGRYFITICVEDRHKMLGEIVGAGSSRPQSLNTLPQICLSTIGEIVDKCINEIPKRYQNIQIDNYVIMPNHVHVIICILGDVNKRGFGQRGREDPAPTNGIENMVGYLKYQTTKEIDIPGFWQRSYHDHIIRNEEDYQRIYKYIDENPAKWQEDRYFIEKIKD